MQTLKSIINRYMYLITFISVTIILFLIIYLQITTEQKRFHAASIKVFAQIEQVLQETQKEPAYIFSLFCIDPEADFYAIDMESEEIVGTTVAENAGKTPEELGFDLDRIKMDHPEFHAMINGQNSYCIFKKVGSHYLGRAIPSRELYQRIPTTIFQLAVCLYLIALTLSYAVTSYINNYVVEKIQDVNLKLESITEGNLNATFNIRSSLEFSELSDYLNSMIQSLINNNKKMSYVLSKTNLYIGVYEHNHRKKNVRYTEYVPRILALDEPKMEQLSSDYDSFRAFLDEIRRNPVPGESGIYRLGEPSNRYVRLEETKEHEDIFGVLIDVTDSMLRQKKIEFERDMDLLTGLYNRRGLDNQIHALFQTPETLGCSAFVMIDADGLKTVNDTYGHEKGDIYLKKVSDIICNFGARGCVAARQSGDEFILFLYQYDTEEELIHTIKTLEYTQNHSFAELDAGLVIPLSFSFGYCLTQKGADYQDLIREADRKMYENKRKRKKNRSSFHK